MSLKLRLKERLFLILDLLPEKQGFYFYHKIQDTINGENMSQRVKTNEQSFEVLKRLLQQKDLSIEGKNILEIGSGWVPIMPYFMLYRGKAKSISTFDLNRHFSKNKISRLNEVFQSEYGIRVTQDSTNPYRLPKKITYYPNTDLINADLPEAELVFSRFVLEHVKPDDLALMHEKFKRELKPGSLIVHLISPSDHRAYVDKNLSLQDFLQYSEAEWKGKQTKFDYHNRLRLPQYLAIFKAAGLELLHVEYDKPGADTFKRFSSVPIHEDFKNFTDEELTAGSINVVLKL
ncbi:class I SAM-dependent methyltransferase [Salegentibacter sp. JZCK2]|uniref:class I SAM-dependent methyltransferase n=1 Tax=Salegentibacter tibetensis TaxID=2873600 RepID=UPI001CCF9662|nr:class I SAM-dependent methyltransferase [Salegentibacter tibetensis]MBZ9729757.1 class I SAM-dependent methyltransferase [Salegentibacter tibetensis]